MQTAYDLPEVPAGLVPTYGTKDGEVLPDGPKWSGATPPPAVGARVNVRVNGLGFGTVVSYFVEAGWLGLCVKLENPPEWHVKQNKGRRYAGHALAFGMEVSL